MNLPAKLCWRTLTDPKDSDICSLKLVGRRCQGHWLRLQALLPGTVQSGDADMQNHVAELTTAMVGGPVVVHLQDTTRDPYDSTRW